MKHASRSSSSWLLILLAITGYLIACRQYILDLQPSELKIPTKEHWIETLRRAVSESGNFPVEGNLSNVEALGRLRPDYYVVFSTSCSQQMDWESFVLFYHALKVGQPGNVTRIASGCSPREETELREFHRKIIHRMSDRFHVHFTPGYSTIKRQEDNRPYKYMNKPFGLRHWMENELGLRKDSAIPERLRNSIVMLLDPDMVLLRPLVHDFSNEHVLWVTTDPSTKVVKQGYPIAQQDGYLHNQWMTLNFSYITNRTEGDYVSRPPENDGPRFWNTGPPYLATVTGKIPKTNIQLDIYPLSGLTGWCLRHVQLGRQVDRTYTTNNGHTRKAVYWSLVVSDPTANNREGWPYIDELHNEQVCEHNSSAMLPIGLHYCKRYNYGECFFSKYRLKKNIMLCHKPILKSPPSDLLGKYDYAILPPRADGLVTPEERITISGKRAKREVYMLCGMIKAVNEALRYYKNNFCNGELNVNESYSIHEDPSEKW